MSGMPAFDRLLMHQLGDFRGSAEWCPHLDSHAFAQQVQALLAQLPLPLATPALTHPAH